MNIGSYVWGCIGAAALARFTTFLGQTTGHLTPPAIEECQPTRTICRLQPFGGHQKIRNHSLPNLKTLLQRALAVENVNQAVLRPSRRTLRLTAFRKLVRSSTSGSMVINGARSPSRSVKNQRRQQKISGVGSSGD